MILAMLTGLALGQSADSTSDDQVHLEVASGHSAAVECLVEVGGQPVSVGRDGAVLVWDRATGRIIGRRSGPVTQVMSRLGCAAVDGQLAFASEGRVGFLDPGDPDEPARVFAVGQEDDAFGAFGEARVVAGERAVFAWAHGASAEAPGLYRYEPERGLTGAAATESWLTAAGVSRGDDEVLVATREGWLQRWKVTRRGGRLRSQARVPEVANEGGGGGLDELPTTFAGLTGQVEGIHAIGQVGEQVIAVHADGRLLAWDDSGVHELAQLGDFEEARVHGGGVVFASSWELGTWTPERGVVRYAVPDPLQRVAVFDGQPVGLGERGLILELDGSEEPSPWTGSRLRPIDRLVLQPGHLVVLRPGAPLIRWALDGGPPRAHVDTQVDPKSHRPRQTLGLDALPGTSLALERIGEAPIDGEPLYGPSELCVVDLDSGEVVHASTFQHERADGRWRFLSKDQLVFSGSGGMRMHLDPPRLEPFPIAKGFRQLQPRGDRVAIGHGHDRGTTLWDLRQDAVSATLPELNGPFRSSLTWNEQGLYGVGFEGEVYRVDPDTGEAAEQWVGWGSQGLPIVGPRPGSTELAMPLGRGWLTVWDPAGERVVDDEEWGVERLVEEPVSFGAHVGWIRALQWLDRDRLLTAGEDGVVHVWEIGDEARRLCSLYAFDDESWAVVDPEGRYDASDAGEVEHLHWVVDGEPVALSQLKARYWHPGLLGACTGLGRAAVRDVEGLDEVALHPETSVHMQGERLVVGLDGRSGGIGAVRVHLNGKEIAADLRELGSRGPGPAELNLSLDLGESELLLPGQENVVEVFAENADGSLISRGIQARFQVQGTKRAPRLFGVVVGTSDYEGTKLDLRFAARDAIAFAEALRAGGAELFDEVDVRLLATEGEGAIPPTRAAVRSALEALITRTRPEDVVVVYVAGHGVVSEGEGSELQLLLADAWTSDVSDPAVRERVALSSGELTRLLTSMPASKQVLVLDTCHSGKVLDSLTAARAVPGAQIRALDRMKDRTGLFVIAGSAADSVSYEATRYGQGLLTYSLLGGMRGAALRDGSLWDVSRLFSYAGDRVPQLARGIGGVQRPVVAMPRGGGSFDIGRVTPEVRRRIPLAQDRPVVLRSNFQDEERFADVRGLSESVDEALRDRSAGVAAPFVFVDGTGWDEAVLVAGRYREVQGGLALDVRVLRGAERIGAWSGQVTSTEQAAARIIALVEQSLKARRTTDD